MRSRCRLAQGFVRSLVVVHAPERIEVALLRGSGLAHGCDRLAFLYPAYTVAPGHFPCYWSAALPQCS